MSEDVDPWSKFRFWLGVTVVGFMVMSMSSDGPFADIGALGCCFGSISATIAAIAASQSKGAGGASIGMLPAVGTSAHQVMTPGELISQLTEIATSQGMTNAVAIRHFARVEPMTPIDVEILRIGIEAMGVARLDEASSQAIFDHLDFNEDQVLQESEVAPHQTQQLDSNSQSGAVTAESMINHLSSMASADGTSLDELLRTNSSVIPNAPVEPLHVQEALSQLGIATIDEASADVLLREMAPSLESLDTISATIPDDPVATKAMVEKHLNEILDKTVSMDQPPEQVLKEATPHLMALADHLDPETKSRVLSAWNQSVTPTLEDSSAMDPEKRAAIAKGVAGAVAGLTLTGAAAAGAASLRSSLSSVSTAAPSVTGAAFGDAERVIEEFREEATLIAEEGGDIRSIENTLRTAMRAKTADLPFGVKQKVERQLEDLIHTTAKEAVAATSQAGEKFDSTIDAAAETMAAIEEVAVEKVESISEEVKDKIETTKESTKVVENPPLSPSDDTSNLLSLHEKISGLSMHSERQALISELKNPLSFEMVVERTERSFSVSADHLRGGQTIHGHLQESPNASIQVRIPPNTEVPKTGGTFQVVAFVKEWSAMRRSLVFNSQE